jgi:chromosome segregation protein
MTSIQKLKLYGFKSFPKVTEISFPKGYSCVIGPNGSGKSNIMDAFCFVFGKGSAKGLRAEKSANLVYNGGKLGTPMKEAEVSIWLDNSKKTFPVTEKSVKITRIVKKDGNSIYKINDKTMKRQEMVELLNSGKIDPDGHNIILQGDIVRFMELKPEQRRGVMEEVAGISVYDDKKRKAIGELDKVDLRLKEVNIILTERHAHLRELKKDRDQALRYKEIEGDIKSNKATYINFSLKTKEEIRDEVEKKIKDTEGNISKINETINSFKDFIKSKKEEIKNINSEIEKRGEKEQVALHKEVETLKTDLVRKNSRVEVCRNEIIKINLRKQQLRKDSADLENRIKDLKKTIDKYEKDKLNFEGELKKVEVELDKLRKKYNVSDSNNIRDKLMKLNSEKNELLREKDKIEYQLNQFSDADIKDGDTLKIKFKDVAKELENSLINDDKYIVELGRLRNRLVKKNEELAKLNIEDSSYKQITLDSISIKKIMNAGIGGVYDIVSELGKVNKKYSIALEVAAGSRLKSVVVEDDKIAQKCINFLKENKLGVATFLPLNKIKGNSKSGDYNITGLHGRAIDLVKFDSKFKDVFEYVFGNTLVVDNIDIARKIGIGTNRMVTLSGDLVEVSGAMVGGHRKKSGYQFKEVDFDDKIGRLSSEVSELKNSINEFENLKINNGNKIYELKKEKGDLEGQLIKMNKLVNTGDTKDLSKDLIMINSSLDKFEKEIEICNKSLENIKDTGVDSVREIEDKRNGIKEKIIKIESEIKNFGMNISSILIPEKEKILSIVRGHDKEVHSFSEEIESLDKEIKLMNEGLKEKEKTEKAFYSEFRNLFNQRNKITEIIQTKENGLVREEEKTRNFENRINSFNLERAKLVAEIEGLEKEFEPYKNEKIKRNVDFGQLKYEINRLEKEFSNLGNVNLRALEIYDEIQEEFNKLTEKSDKLRIEREDVLEMMNEIEVRKKDLFLQVFDVVSKKFSENFDSLSDKGKAVMDLENRDDPLNGGVDMKVKLTGSRYLDIKGLSGGEKTMAALAFIFSIQEFTPAPFYLLDEVDAALDKHNSEKLSKLIKQYSNNAQYIVISHNDSVITEADQIYGISMQQGISKIVSLKL